MLQIGIDIGGGSVKAAAVRGGVTEWTGKSEPYSRPRRSELEKAIAEAAVLLRESPAAVGVCAPGLLNESRTAVTHSVNVPGLVDVPLVELLGNFGTQRPPVVASDANATAYDIYLSGKLTGRLVALVIGTGVGAAVVDEGGTFLRVDGDSPGHLGQCDVSIEGHPVVGPDGGAGSLEGYFGTPALAARYGSVDAALREMKADHAPLQALARVIRIAHGIYRPQHVCLAGGIGIRMTHLLPALRELVDDRLTRIARPDWTLTTGRHDFHAALGVARLAGL